MAWEPKKPLSIETVEVAPPKAGEVRIKVSIDTQFPKTVDSISENFLCQQQGLPPKMANILDNNNYCLTVTWLEVTQN